MFAKIARKRRSVRKFLARDVPDKVVEAVLRVAIQAPSAMNKQSWEFIVVRDLETRRRLSQASFMQGSLVSAPVVIAVCGNTKRAGGIPIVGPGAEEFAATDAIIAAAYIQLAALDKKLGTVWVGGFDRKQVAAILGLPDYVKPVALVPMGYPAEKPKPHGRLPLEKVLHTGRYGQPQR
ncbi:MAG: nitroreductase family protein [Candidatus Micrarchaeia archaeon]